MPGDTFHDLVTGIVDGRSQEFDAMAKLCFPHYYYYQEKDWHRIAGTGEGFLLLVKNKAVVCAGDYRKELLKIPKPEIYNKQHKLQRFFEGCGIQSKLHREMPFNIPEVYWANPKKPYFYSMEWIEGVDLLKYAQHRSDEQLLEIFCKVLAVVNTMHEFNFIHRDLKPGNIYVVKHNGEEIPVLLDFGLAKIPEEERGITGTGNGMGSTVYASYKSITDAEKANFEDDVWSLARILWVIFTREEPKLPRGTIFADHRFFPEEKLFQVDPLVLSVYSSWKDGNIKNCKQFLKALGSSVDQVTIPKETSECIIHDTEEKQYPQGGLLQLIEDLVQNTRNVKFVDDPTEDAFIKSVWLSIHKGVEHYEKNEP